MNKDGYMDIRTGWMRGTSGNEILFKKSFLLLTKTQKSRLFNS